jgi:predicted nucleotidyltransferase
MNILGIIAEYNPFHNGHKYHIQQAKKITNSDYVVVIMSGNFTQSGNAAIYDKFTRAKIASEYGADLVIELPTIYATSSAESFAYGSILLLDSLNIINSICFGCEEEDITILNHISNILIDKNDLIYNIIKKELKQGISYPKAREIALTNFLNTEELNIIKKPNNILGIEYLKALKQLNSNITPYCIKRNSSNFNEILPNKNSNKYTSATSIRNMISMNKLDLIENYVPASSYTCILNKEPLFNEKLYRILKYKILTTDTNTLKTISEITEGLEYKLKSEIARSNSYEDLINNLKSKRYTMTRIKRLLINILLNITKDKAHYAKEHKIIYAHILALGYNGKELLSTLTKNSNIEIITKINDKVLNSLDNDTLNYLKMDILSSNIYYTLSNDIINKDYTNRL